MKGEGQTVNFKYIKLPAMRFIGIDAWRTKEEWLDMWIRRNEFLPKLEEGMKERISSAMPWVCSFMHHDDGEVDVINRYLIGHFLNLTRWCRLDMTIMNSSRRQRRMRYLKMLVLQIYFCGMR